MLEREPHERVRPHGHAREHRALDPERVHDRPQVPALAGDLGAVMDALGIERAVLAGASMGAHTLVRFALEHPERAAALVIATPAFDPDAQAGFARWDALSEGLRSGGVDGFVAAYGDPPVPERFKETVRRILHQRLGAHEHPEAVADALAAVPRSRPFESWDVLADLDMPAVVVASRDEADPDTRTRSPSATRRRSRARTSSARSPGRRRWRGRAGGFPGSSPRPPRGRPDRRFRPACCRPAAHRSLRSRVCDPDEDPDRRPALRLALAGPAQAQAPTATTDPATHVADRSATLNGTVDAAAVANAYFEYGLTTAYGDVTSTQIVVGPHVEADIQTLTPDTNYHFRLVATDADGTVLATGQDREFHTGAAPVAATGAATAITETAATLGGTVNPKGLDTSFRFEYGLTAAYGTTTASAAAGSDATGHAVSAPLVGLEPHTTYHYRIVASNGGGFTTGNDASFTTPAFPPVVVTGAASAISATAATLGGTVNPRGTEATYRFDFGTDTTYGVEVAGGSASAAATRAR